MPATEPDPLPHVAAELLLIHRLRGLDVAPAPPGARERCWRELAARLEIAEAPPEPALRATGQRHAFTRRASTVLAPRRSVRPSLALGG